MTLVDDRTDTKGAPARTGSQTVCVLIAAYNARQTIGRAVRSALAQPEVSEVIIVDDASPDDTAAVAEQEDDGTGRLKVLRLRKNAGPSGARNAGLKIATADFVTPLDSDDYMLPGRLGKMLESVDGADILADDLLRQIEGSNEILPGNLLQLQPGSLITLTLQTFIESNISRTGKNRRELGFLKPLIRRQFLLDHGLQYDKRLRLGEDYALYARALNAGAKFLLMPACGYVAVHRSDSLSSSHSIRDLEALFNFDLEFLNSQAFSYVEREAIARHLRSIHLKVEHRYVLEDKAAGRYLSIASRLGRQPLTLAYVVAQTLQDKKRAWASPPPPPPPAPVWAREPEMEFLFRAVRSYLVDEPEPGLASMAARVDDWDGLLQVALENRLATLLNLGLRRNGVTVPADVQGDLDGYRADTLRRNSRNMQTARAAVQALNEAGIETVLFKGPIQQQRLYGEAFIKSAGDVDLLVSPEQYQQAVSVLERTHYVDPECATLWWRVFLGEQALRPREATATTVDLHHRLQQPGCPSPNDTGRFIQRRRAAPVGAVEVPVLSPSDACLLMCMSIAKALVHREAAASHVADLVMAVRKLSDAEFDRLLADAKAQSLTETVHLGLHAAEILYDFRDGRAAQLKTQSRRFAAASESDIAHMIVMPRRADTVWPKRRRILWDLCGHNPLVFVREASWALGGELCRQYVQVGRAKPRAASESIIEATT